jgi:hypothetical protein
MWLRSQDETDKDVCRGWQLEAVREAGERGEIGTNRTGVGGAEERQWVRQEKKKVKCKTDK